MKGSKNIFTNNFIKRHLSGQLSDPEKEVLASWPDESFEKEALEGLESLNAQEFIKDVEALESRIRIRTKTEKKGIFRNKFFFLQAAASITLLLSLLAGWRFIYLSKQNKTSSVSENITYKNQDSSTDTLSIVKPNQVKSDEKVTSQQSNPLLSPFKSSSSDLNSTQGFPPMVPQPIDESDSEELANLENAGFILQDSIEGISKSQQNPFAERSYKIDPEEKALSLQKAPNDFSSKIITGQITDSITGEALIGATVYIKAKGIATTTDMRGNYRLAGVEAGDTLRYSYVGYEQENVHVQTNTLVVNPKMKSDINLQAVVIEASRTQNTEAPVLKDRKDSNNLQDAISLQQMERAASLDAAQALQKIPGVSIVHGRKISLRDRKDRNPLSDDKKRSKLKKEEKQSSAEESIQTTPTPTIGIDAYKKYLSNALRYPEAAIKNKIEGIVVLSFYVEVNGSFTNISVEKGLGYGCNEEAIRLLQQGPSWTPAYQSNQPIRELTRLEIPFKISN